MNPLPPAPGSPLPAWLKAGGNGRDAHLQGRQLPGFDLRDLRGDAIDFSAADLTGADFTRAHLDACPMADARLVRARFAQATLRLADFSRADASDADFSHAQLEDSRFESARADQATFHGTHLSETSFARSSLPGASFAEAQGEGTSFRGADLRGASFAGAQLADADFRGADLRGADLSRARLVGADFRGAQLDEVLWQEATWDAARFDEGAGPAAAAATPGPRALPEPTEAPAEAARDFGPEVEQLAASFLRRLQAGTAGASPTRVPNHRLPPANPAEMRALLGALNRTLTQRGGASGNLFQGLEQVLQHVEGGATGDEPPAEWRDALQQILGRLPDRGRDATASEVIAAILGKPGSKPPK